MERLVKNYIRITICTLYPTLFRWNWYAVEQSDLSSFLYIPHCSDGTSKTLKKLEVRPYFISHIVQMERGGSVYSRL